MLRQQFRSDSSQYVKKRTSPIIAFLLSGICPGLGAAYNGQTLKALVYFAVFVGLFQMAVISGGAPMFVVGFIGMWLFAALDAWRTAQMIRSGVTPESADDILVKRFSGNPMVWGIVLGLLGLAFLAQRFFGPGNVSSMIKFFLPVAMIGLGIYILKGYVFDRKKNTNADAPQIAEFAVSATSSSDRGYNVVSDISDRGRTGGWRDA